MAPMKAATARRSLWRMASAGGRRPPPRAGGRRPAHLPQGGQQSLAAEKVALEVGGVGQPVGVEEKEIAAGQNVFLLGVGERRIDGQRKAGGAEVDEFIPLRPVEQGTVVAGVGEPDSSAVAGQLQEQERDEQPAGRGGA